MDTIRVYQGFPQEDGNSEWDGLGPRGHVMEKASTESPRNFPSSREAARWEADRLQWLLATVISTLEADPDRKDHPFPEVMILTLDTEYHLLEALEVSLSLDPTYIQAVSSIARMNLPALKWQTSLNGKAFKALKSRRWNSHDVPTNLGQYQLNPLIALDNNVLSIASGRDPSGKTLSDLFDTAKAQKMVVAIPFIVSREAVAGTPYPPLVKLIEDAKDGSLNGVFVLPGEEEEVGWLDPDSVIRQQLADHPLMTLLSGDASMTKKRWQAGLAAIYGPGGEGGGGWDFYDPIRLKTLFIVLKHRPPYPEML